jgi:hypothetical protein
MSDETTPEPVFEQEPERPAPIAPVVPLFKELSVPESIPTSLQGEAVTVTPAPAPSFHVPTSLKVLAAALVPILGVLAVILPVPFGPVAAVSAFIAAGLLGLSLPMPKFMAGRPLVPLALVPLLTTVATALGQLAFTQPPDSKAYFYLYAGACLCALLAGVAAPQPGQSLKS